MHREPDVGFDPGSPGSRPGPKAGAKPLRHPGIPGPRKFNKNPLLLDKQRRTDAILCYTCHPLYDPYINCLLLKVLPHPSQAFGHTPTQKSAHNNVTLLCARQNCTPILTKVIGQLKWIL